MKALHIVLEKLKQKKNKAIRKESNQSYGSCAFISKETSFANDLHK